MAEPVKAGAAQSFVIGSRTPRDQFDSEAIRYQQGQHANLMDALEELGHPVDRENFTARMHDPEFAEDVRTALKVVHEVPDSSTFFAKYGGRTSLYPDPEYKIDPNAQRTPSGSNQVRVETNYDLPERATQEALQSAYQRWQNKGVGFSGLTQEEQQALEEAHAKSKAAASGTSFEDVKNFMDTKAGYVPLGAEKLDIEKAKEEARRVTQDLEAPPVSNVDHRQDENNILQNAYQGLRTFLSYPVAAIPAAAESLIGSREKKSMPDSDIPAERTTFGSRFADEFAAARPSIAKGEGILGSTLADPLAVGSVALLPALRLGGAALDYVAPQFAKKLAAQAGKAIPEFVTSGAQAAKSGINAVKQVATKTLPGDLAYNTAMNAALGAGFSGAQNVLDPNRRDQPMSDALGEGALGGAALGLAGRILQRWGVSAFPGMGTRYNMKVPEEDKELVAANLESTLSRGFLPQTRQGMLNASEKVQQGLNAKYRKAQEALSAAEPDLLLGTKDWEDRSERALRTKLGEWTSGLLEYAPEATHGYRLPDAARQALEDKFSRVKATKLYNIGKDLSKIEGFPHGHLDDPSINKLVETQARINRKLNKKFGLNADPDVLAASLTNNVRDEIPLSPLAKQMENDLGGFHDVFGPRFIAAPGSPEEAQAIKALNDWQVANLSPEELSRARTNIAVDPKTYADPIQEVARIKRHTGQAMHDAANEILMAHPAYKDVLVNPKKGVNVPFDWKKEASLQNIIEHPGAIGLADRLNLLGVLNPAVSPWFKASTLYKGGSALRRAGFAPFTADITKDILDVAQNGINAKVSRFAKAKAQRDSAATEEKRKIMYKALDKMLRSDSAKASTQGQ